MNQEMKEKWLKALRSGKYKQAKGQLRLNNSDGEHTYCCLGVLCTLNDKVIWNGNTAKAGTASGFGLPSEVQQDCKLHHQPCIVLDKVNVSELRVSDDVVAMLENSGNICYELWRLNDGGASFEDIAELIEHCELV